MVKKALQLTPGIEPLYGTRDENLQLMEDGLGVQIDLRSDSIHVLGEAAEVSRVEGIFADFERFDIVPQSFAVAPRFRRVLRQHHLGMDDATFGGEIVAAIQPLVTQP